MAFMYKVKVGYKKEENNYLFDAISNFLTMIDWKHYKIESMEVNFPKNYLAITFPEPDNKELFVKDLFSYAIIQVEKARYIVDYNKLITDFLPREYYNIFWWVPIVNNDEEAKKFEENGK